MIVYKIVLNQSVTTACGNTGRKLATQSKIHFCDHFLTCWSFPKSESHFINDVYRIMDVLIRQLL